jgi:HD-GYP domain-containing protein (c-di-GMP phosphodiesterase class II)
MNLQLHRQRRPTGSMALLLLAEQAGACTVARGKAVRTAALQIADGIGMRRTRRDALADAALLLDIGLVALDADEYELHPMRSLQIVRHQQMLNESYSGILHHHERFDGTGYPMGFTGHEIPEFARILAIADARGQMSREELVARAGSYFDPELVAVYKRMGS